MQDQIIPAHAATKIEYGDIIEEEEDSMFLFKILIR
jgi:hypothetical protein